MFFEAINYNEPKFIAESSYVTLAFHEEELVNFELWDTRGESQSTYFDGLRTLCYADTDIVLILYSIADRNSFDNVLEEWYPEISREASGSPIVLAATKKDVRNHGR